jgi:hypothetical protein
MPSSGLRTWKTRKYATQKQRKEPGQYRELDGLQIEIERQQRGENIGVVSQRRTGDETAETVALKEAGGDHHQDRRHEERHQHQQQW